MCTILAYARSKGIVLSNGLASRLGRQAAKLCREQGIERQLVEDMRWGTVGTYPEPILDLVFAEEFSREVA